MASCILGLVSLGLSVTFMVMTGLWVLFDQSHQSFTWPLPFELPSAIVVAVTAACGLVLGIIVLVNPRLDRLHGLLGMLLSASALSGAVSVVRSLRVLTD